MVPEPRILTDEDIDAIDGTSTMPSDRNWVHTVRYWKRRSEAAERERDALRAEVERYKVLLANHHKYINKLEVQVAALRAALAALEAKP